MMCTIYKNIFDNTPHYVDVSKLLERIRTGRSEVLVKEIRTQLDKERANKLKANLPSICFSGQFKERKDNALIKHSGLICLDFDNVAPNRRGQLMLNVFIFALWVSPSGKGLKALVKIKHPEKHRQHFEALRVEFPDVDKSGINESRVCYESSDPSIYVNKDAVVWGNTKEEAIVQHVAPKATQSEVFEKVVKWLSNKGDAFRTGERNLFIFKLASACCRFGISESESSSLCRIAFSADNSFTDNEMKRTVKSAYITNASSFATAEFTNDRLTDKKTKYEITTKEISADIYNLEIRPKDVIFGEDVKREALDIYENGFNQVMGVGINSLDHIWKMKKSEISLLTGIGNYGKSTFLKWYIIVRVLKFEEKFAFFTPEDNPAQEFYHDLTEIYLGQDCTPSNFSKPSRELYERTYDLLAKSIFYIYPKEISPTPEYIKERFLELIIKEKIVGCIIDPFNQLTNDYGSTGGRTDKYLETFLSDCSRFAQVNNVYFLIIAHPKRLDKPKGENNYPEPDVFDIADGAMWNNKMDNILVYHRPRRGDDPKDPVATLSSKKIRRQKIVGKLDTVAMVHDWKKRRFIFEGKDIIAELLNDPNEKKIEFEDDGSGLPF